MRQMLFLFLLTICYSVTGQINDSIKQESESIQPPFKKDFKYYFGHIPLKTLHRSKKLDVQIDTRNSFVKDFPINVYGLNVGVVLRERFRFGVGYYWINQSFNDKLLGIYATNFIKGKFYPNIKGRVITTAKGIPIPVSKLESAGLVQNTDFFAAAQQIDLWFTSVGFMYTFYASRLVEFAIPIEIGYGRFSEKLYDISGNDFGSLGASLKPGVTQGYFVPGQIGFDMLIKPHRWAYIDATIGYRQTLIQNYDSKYRATSFDSQFDGEYYSVGVKIQLGTIVKEWKTNKKKKTNGTSTTISIKE
jgi:hypothetical protein